MTRIPEVEPGVPHIAIIGNPNCGKSTIFNALTGLRQKVSNYPGVTVEKHEGRVLLPNMGEVHAIDLPGTYSLNPRSADEIVAHDVLLGLYPDTPEPQVIVAVADASALERSLFLVLQLLSLGKPTILALNMMDVAERLGQHIDVSALSRELKIPVVPMVASRLQGVSHLRALIGEALRDPRPARDTTPIPPRVNELIQPIADALAASGFVRAAAAQGEALRLLCTDGATQRPRYQPVRHRIEPALQAAKAALTHQNMDGWALEAEIRYQYIDDLAKRVVARTATAPTRTDRIDAWLLHPVWGPLFLGIVLIAVFIAIFTLAQYPMGWIENLFNAMALWVARSVPPGPLQDLLTQGVIAGVGGVLAFLPQIMLLFLFIAIFEDSGYAARIAFLVDHAMSRFGLHGKACLPLFSSCACAIPGIMATRVIDNEKDRLVTILVAPFMCCSARWPVYLLIAGTVIPHRRVLGFVPLPAMVLGGMFLAGIAAVIVTALAVNRALFRQPPMSLALDLPRYRMPQPHTLLHIMWERSALFIRKAGTIILAMSIVMWALTYYPRKPDTLPGTQIEHSYAGRIGHAIEPVLRPIGFDWRIGVAALSSLVAREVFVSSIATIFEVQVADPHSTGDLQTRLQQETDPDTGEPFFSPLRGICIMLFYVLSMQCLSTFVVVRRETGGWRWPIFQWLYMTGLAWLVCFAVWQIGTRLG
jgi:ferrous iron transport protein B